MTDVFTLVYSSLATTSFDDGELARLLAASREKNEAIDVTGMLLYREGRFIQVLEGPESAVRSLLGRIRQDPRHEAVRVLLTAHHDGRAFADWTMGYQPVRAMTEPVPAGFRDTFADLDAAEDVAGVTRAVQELTAWFKIRSGPRPS